MNVSKSVRKEFSLYVLVDAVRNGTNVDAES